MKTQRINNMDKNQQKTLWQRVTNPFEKKQTNIISATELQDANLEFLRRMNIKF
jgi:hypothetical protein